MNGNGKGRNGLPRLKEPPAQTVPGVILYHGDAEIDERIRTVRQLRYDFGYDVPLICKVVERGSTMVHEYLRQIAKAKLLYMAAFPEEFGAGVEGIREAIHRREALDRQLRQKLVALDDANNVSAEIGVFKCIEANLQRLEELRGLLTLREPGPAVQVVVGSGASVTLREAEARLGELEGDE